MYDSIGRIQHAMGGTLKNLELITNNIANVNTPDYKRQYVDFSSGLENKILSLKNTDDMHLTGTQSFDGFQVATDNTILKEDGNNVDIDAEITQLQDSNLRYQSMISLVNRDITSLKNVILSK